MLLLLLIFVITLLCYLVHYQISYWKKLKVPGPKPLPFLGNLGKNVIGKASPGEIYAEIYRKYEGYPFVGIYNFASPSLLVRDVDFVKNVMVRDFRSFQENSMSVDEEVDPILGKNPFVMKGSEWKEKRSQLLSCFTSGKMKGMYPLIQKCSERMVKYVDEQIQGSNCMECRELCVRFTLDNVALCAFGVEGRNFDEPYSNFRKLADRFLNPDNIWHNLQFLSIIFFPSLARLFKFKILKKDVEDELMEIVRSALKYRKENNVVRNDFLDAISSFTSKSSSFTELDITAQASSFFADGYETSSRVMSFLIFELAMNPEAQEKLRYEIEESYRKNGDKFTYESINELTYLDACFQESLRKNPVALFLSKKCTEKYTYTPSVSHYENISVTLEPGTAIIIPVGALQNDPKYFESPDEFKPERFLSKDSSNKSAFLPFGDGPRICVGQRFGTIQIKVAVAHLIKSFELKVNPRMKFPLKFDPWFLLSAPVGGLWIDIKKLE